MKIEGNPVINTEAIEQVVVSGPRHLKAAWRTGLVTYDDRAINSIVAAENEELLTGIVIGHHRTRRGVYDLLFSAMRACGLHLRNPERGL